MSNSQFDGKDNKSIFYSRFEADSRPPKMVEWLLRTGIVKTTWQANYIFLAISVIFTGLAVYFFTSMLCRAPGRDSYFGQFPSEFSEGITR